MAYTSDYAQNELNNLGDGTKRQDKKEKRQAAKEATKERKQMVKGTGKVAMKAGGAAKRGKKIKEVKVLRAKF